MQNCVDLPAPAVLRQCMSRRIVRLSTAWRLGTVLGAALLPGFAIAQSGAVVLERDGRFISLVPYAPNIVRVTISISRAAATSAPGYGFVASPSTAGWTHERDP
jgi:alpha-glucosidase/alpha-D-xyloside xylohydrolase